MLFFSLSTFNIYSQFLGPEDIDIFINRGSEIDNYITKEDNTESVNMLTTAVLLALMFRITISAEYLPEEVLIGYIDSFYAFLSIPPGEEYKKVMREVGWENYGHQKYWAIFFGSRIIIQDSYKEHSHRIFSFFGNKDLELINSRINDIIESMKNRIWGS
jgi:hypothetical protein